jgi:Ca2+-dependent lipid-binding protein
LKFETKVAASAGKAPVWNESFPYVVAKGMEEVSVEVFDKEDGKAESILLGSGKASVKEGGEVTVPLVDKQKKSQGKVFLKFAKPSSKQID